MAKTVIKNVAFGLVKKVSFKTPFISTFKTKERKATIKETLPFRVKFTNVGITHIITPGGQPIGIAVIGYNNYIL
jgi:hypothetical protein